MVKLTKKKKLYICAFLLPFLAVVLMCIQDGVYPFGENCLLRVDMYHQYEPFFTEFMDKLKHGGSLMYSFRLGLGSDFVALFAYYLASPLNWLLALCPSGHVIEFMSMLILWKVGLCGLSVAVYLGNRFEGMGFEGVAFASFYALSSYVAAYSWNIMWLDCLALAPVVVLGLERLVRLGDGRLYGASLGIAVLSNFYIAIMLCIFLTLYFLVFLLEEVRGIRAKLIRMGRFALYSLLGGGMGAILILPEIAVLGYSGSSGNSFPSQLEWYFDLVSLLARHCMGVRPHMESDHWPNLYCGVSVILLLILYLCNRKISRGKKIKYTVLIVFFWLSFANNMLDFIWHGLHFPVGLPGRQAYLYSFLLVVVAYEAYRECRGNTFWHLGIGVLVTLAFLAAAAFVVDTGIVSAKSLAVTGALTLGYAALLFLHIAGTRTIRRLARGIFLGLAVLELVINADATGFSTTNRTAYTKHWESIRGLLQEVQAEDPMFYRVERMERLTKNDAEIYGYNSSTIFSSLSNIGVSRFYRKVGMEGGKNFYSYSGATPLTSAMLSVKYQIATNPYEENALRKLVAEDGQNYIYQNLYSLPLGFMTDPYLESNWNVQDKEPVGNLNRLARCLGAKEDLLTPLENAVAVEEDITTVTASEEGYLFGVYSDASVKDIQVVNGKRKRKFGKCDHGYLLDLGWCEAGDSVEVTNTSEASHFSIQAYRLNLDALKQAYETLNSQTMEVDSFQDTLIEGHITVTKPGDLIVSIPQEMGWSIYVDGVKTESKSFMDSLIKIPLISGEHTITLRYRTPWLLPGAGVSVICLALFAFLCVREGRRQKAVASGQGER